MVQRKESSDTGGQMGLDTWVIEDLETSGLTPDKFLIESLTAALELEERLGFTALTDHNGNSVKITDIGG